MDSGTIGHTKQNLKKLLERGHFKVGCQKFKIATVYFIYYSSQWSKYEFKSSHKGA